jgi:predicted MFS family arabinose efflux permease
MFGLLAGALADRVRRRRLMIGADLAAGTILLTVPVAHLAGSLTIPHVLAAAFGVWTAFVWFDAAAWGALVRVVSRARLTAANSLIWSASTVIGMAIPAAAGVLAALTHPAMVLAVTAVSYLGSAVLTARIRTDLDPPPGPDRTRRSLRAEIGAGLTFIWRTGEIRALTLAGTGLSVSGGAVLALLVVHADQVVGLARDDSRIGLLFTAGAAGALCAALLLPRVSRWWGAGRVSLVAYGGFVPALVALALSGNLALALLTWLMWQAAYTMAITNGITIRQQLTPDAMQGRVNTTGRMIAMGGVPFGALLGGLLADQIGVQATYLLACAPVVAATVAIWASSVPRLRLS